MVNQLLIPISTTCTIIHDFICFTDFEIVHKTNEQKRATVRVLLIIFSCINTLFNFITFGRKVCSRRITLTASVN